MITGAQIQETLDQVNSLVEQANPHIDFEDPERMLTELPTPNQPDILQFDEDTFPTLLEIINRNISVSAFGPTIFGVTVLKLGISMGVIIGRQEAARLLDESTA